MRTVRTTMQPDRQIDVDDATFVDFERQGILLDPEPTPSAPPAAAPAVPAAPAKKTTTTAKSD